LRKGRQWMDELLEVKKLNTVIDQEKDSLHIINDLSLTVNKGQVVAIVGESGSGKSMTALSIMQLLPEPGGRIASGEVIFDGKDLAKYTEDQMCKVRGKDISMIFQEPMTSLNPVLTIGEQITEIIIEHENVSQSEATKRAIKLLKDVGIPRAAEIINDYPHRLSGGMRQRVMIAMAMSCDPKLIIADEPTTALDVTIQYQILQLLRKLVKENDASVIIITHDLGVVSEIAEIVYVMYAGQIVEIAKVDDVFEEPLHPYTAGLIKSIPRLTGELERLVPIKGNVPTPGNFNQGCRFAPRCERALDICFAKQPEIKQVNGQRSVRCFLYEDDKEHS